MGKLTALINKYRRSKRSKGKRKERIPNAVERAAPALRATNYRVIALTAHGEKK